MSTMTELDTFVQKFRQLWKCGHDANLNVESKNGKAWVNLRLCLDDEPGPPHQQVNFPKFKTSPSRERRKLRREVARQEDEQARKESEMTIIATEEATDVNVDNVDVKSVEAAEHVPVKADTAENVEEAREETATEVAEKANEVLDNSNSDAIAFKENNEVTEAKEGVIEKDVNDDCDSNNKKASQAEPRPVRPSIEVVFATAAIEKSNTNKINIMGKSC